MKSLVSLVLVIVFVLAGCSQENKQLSNSSPVNPQGLEVKVQMLPPLPTEYPRDRFLFKGVTFEIQDYGWFLTVSIYDLHDQQISKVYMYRTDEEWTAYIKQKQEEK
jgi:hypothetical protein